MFDNLTLIYHHSPRIIGVFVAFPGSKPQMHPSGFRLKMHKKFAKSSDNLYEYAPGRHYM